MVRFFVFWHMHVYCYLTLFTMDQVLYIVFIFSSYVISSLKCFSKMYVLTLTARWLDCEKRLELVPDESLNSYKYMHLLGKLSKVCTTVFLTKYLYFGRHCQLKIQHELLFCYWLQYFFLVVRSPRIQCAFSILIIIKRH